MVHIKNKNLKFRYFSIIILLFIFFLLNSCTYDSSLDYPESEELPVVNCIFSPDSAWKLRFTSTQPITGIYDNTGKNVENFSVYENGIVLFENTDAINESDGTYRYKTVKPQWGSIYSIEAYFGDNKLITATDTMPGPPLLKRFNVHNKAMDYPGFESMFYIDTVYQVDLYLEDLSPDTVNYYAIRLYHKEIIYKDILLTWDSLHAMERKGFPEEFIEILKNITGKNYQNIEDTHLRSNYFFEKYKKEFYRYCNKTIDTSAMAKNNKPVDIFVNDPWFSKVSDYNFMVLGFDNFFKNNEYKFSIYTSSLNYWDDGTIWHQGQESINTYYLGETWLEISTLSLATYKYLDTHTKQILSKKNPFSEPVNTYSNVTNGLGIYAGRQVLRIKIHENI